MFEDGGLPYFFSFWVNADELASILKTKYLVRSASVAVSDLSLSLYIYIYIHIFSRPLPRILALNKGKQNIPL